MPDGGGPDDAAVTLVADSFEKFLDQFKKPRAAKGPANLKKTPEWPQLIKTGDVEGVKAWLASGGSLDDKTRDFETPVSLAVHEEQPEILDLLLDQGADPSAAFIFALGGQSWSLVHRILDPMEGQAITLSTFSFQGVLGNCGDVRLIERLVDAGAPLHDQIQRGNALYHATEFRTEPAVVRLLLDRGVEVGHFGHMAPRCRNRGRTARTARRHPCPQESGG